MMGHAPLEIWASPWCSLASPSPQPGPLLNPEAQLPSWRSVLWRRVRPRMGVVVLMTMQTVQQHLECMGCLLSLVRGVLLGPVLQ